MSEPLLFGAIADDYTGAADLASMLTEQGVPTIQIVGVPSDDFVAGLRGRYQAAVIALKTRDVAVPVARKLAVRAAAQLRSLDARQIQFKYCSTFDSTSEGNIGPVTEALMGFLGVDFTVAVPALPVNQRTQYCGHLFVNGVLLSETHMRHHPLTPMTDSNLVRHLQKQSRKKVGLIPFSVVASGPRSIQQAVTELKAAGIAIALVDVLDDQHLEVVAEAIVDMPFITGASGLGMKLPAAWARRGWLSPARSRPAFHAETSGGVLILAGSCSAVTLEQIRVAQAAGLPSFRVHVQALFTGGSEQEMARLRVVVERALRESGRALVYSSAPAPEREETIRLAQAQGVTPGDVHARIQQMMGSLAREAVEGLGLKTVVVAGGETSASVTDALGIQGFEILGAVDPGVPCLRTVGGRVLTLVLKSGNFGSPDFFLKASRHQDR